MSDTGGQLGAEQAGVGRFVGETPNAAESSVDRSRRELPVLKVNPLSRTTVLLKDSRGSEQYHSMTHR